MRTTLRLLAVALLATAATAGTAAAKRRPPSDQGFAAQPPALGDVQGNPTLVLHVQERGDRLERCMRFSKNTIVRARATLRWDGRGRILAASVSGGTAAFNRCAATALRGNFERAIARGTGKVTMTVRNVGAVPGRPLPAPQPTPAPPIVQPAPKPAPKPIVTGDLQACRVDDDCRLHFQTHACIAGNPVAVNAHADATAVQKKFPMTHHACGMGGPQYDELRMSNEGRYSAACEQRRCVVRDAGPQQRGPHRLGF